MYTEQCSVVHSAVCSGTLSQQSFRQYICSAVFVDIVCRHNAGLIAIIKSIISVITVAIAMATDYCKRGRKNLVELRIQ